MAHREQAVFCNSVKEKFPEKFDNVSVLDIGSLDINGNNRYLFSNYKYIGVDLGEGRNVDVVSRGHEFDSPEQFDVVISTECFEHDQFYGKTINNMYRLLKSGGMFIFSAAGEGRPEHGTRRTSPGDAPFIATEGDDYYKNLTEKDIRDVIDLDENFSQYEIHSTSEYCHQRQLPCDIYFWGIKK